MEDQRPYEPLEDRARTAVVWLKAGIIAAGAAVLSDILELGLVRNAMAGAQVTQDQARSNDARQAVVGLAVAVILIGGGIAFIKWFKRAYGNLQPLGSGRGRFRLGWAIWGWLIPFISLARPKQMTNDIWHGSFREPHESPEVWLNRRVPAFVHWWWLLWVAYAIGGSIYRFSGEVALRDLQWIVLAKVAGDTCLMLSGVLAIRLVREVTARQATLHSIVAAPQVSSPSDGG